MCVDFTDLNKACSKDSYLLPCIDLLVDSTAGHQLLSFMDAFSRYNQIRLDETDQENTSFVTSQGLFYYKVRTEERRSDIPKPSEQDVHPADWKERRSVHR